MKVIMQFKCHHDASNGYNEFWTGSRDLFKDVVNEKVITLMSNSLPL